MEASLHPTEVCKSLSSSPLLSEEPIYPIPTCRRPPLGLFSSASIFPTSPTHHSIPFYTDPSRMDTDEDGVTDYIELQGWDVIVIHERRGEVMEDRCEYGVWSLPVRYDSEGDGASDEVEWKFHGNPDSSDSDKDGIPDSEESGPNLTMVEGTPPVILDKKGRDKSSEKYSGAYIKTKVKIKTKWSISGVKIKGKIIVIFTVVDNAGLDRAVIYVQTGGERIIYLGRDKRREIEEVFEIGDLLRLIHGGYDVRVNVTDINGNWATGKTHIDSALQTLKKGLTVLLDMIVAALKVIAKVASMLMDVVKKIVEKIFNPVIELLKKCAESYALDIAQAIQYLIARSSDSNELGMSDIEKVSKELFLSPFFIGLGLLVVVIYAILTIITPFTIWIVGLITLIIFMMRDKIMEAFLGNKAEVSFNINEEVSLTNDALLGLFVDLYGYHIATESNRDEDSTDKPLITLSSAKLVIDILSVFSSSSLLSGAISLMFSIVGLIITIYNKVIEKLIGEFYTALASFVIVIFSYLGSLRAMIAGSNDAENIFGLLGFLIDSAALGFSMFNFVGVVW